MVQDQITSVKNSEFCQTFKELTQIFQTLTKNSRGLNHYRFINEIYELEN